MQFASFKLLPGALVRVEVRPGRLQAFQMEAQGHTVGQEFFAGAPGVNCRAIPQIMSMWPGTSHGKCSRNPTTSSAFMVPSGHTQAPLGSLTRSIQTATSTRNQIDTIKVYSVPSPQANASTKEGAYAKL
jgi:hypothetical protein